MSVRIAVLCSECSYSKSAVCADGAKVCADCGADWPAAPTDAQRETVRYFCGVARETGATVGAELDRGIVWMTETRSAQWDHERTTWLVRADGHAEIQ